MAPDRTSDYPVREQLFQYLKELKKPGSALELVEVIGLVNNNPIICLNLIRSIIADDPRFNYKWEQGWSVQSGSDRDFSTVTPKDSHLSALNIGIQPLVALVGRVDPRSPKNWPHLVQLMAQKAYPDRRGETLGLLT